MLEKNAEGYWDPTAAQALKRIRTEEKKKRRALRQTLCTYEKTNVSPTGSGLYRNKKPHPVRYRLAWGAPRSQSGIRSI